MRRLVFLAVLLATALTAAPAFADPSAVIRRTENGIPHILARDWEGAGYGYGYAFAQDNLCVMADTYVTVRAQRSRFFGPDATYQSRGNGATFKNLDSDFFFQRALNTSIVPKLLAQGPPNGPTDDVRAAVKGYVEGYNRYLADTGVDNLPDPACRGKPWVTPITELDAYMRFWQLGILASQGVAIDGITEAQPPTPGLQSGALADPRTMLEQLKARWHLGIGSNAVALGGQATDNGKGMMLGNPHFPWDGPERFYEAQVTIPGKVNVIGGSLFGVPAVLIGHTDGMAWSHTVSTAFRFTPFELKLVPGSPTTYLYDGQPREMTADKVTVQARQSDGSLKPQTRTLYSSLQGSILTSILGLPLFPWTPERAYAMGDVNAGNFRYLNHFFATDQAQSVRELDGIERKYEGIPWVNTIAADSTGTAYYADIGAIPNVPDAKATGPCGQNALNLVARPLLGLPVLDGSTSSCAWDNDKDAVTPGIFGPSHLPSLFRDDYVTNSNDSYWLSNPKHPLEGFARIIGDERTARTLRTRLGLVMVEDYRPFTTQKLQDMVFNDRQHAGELWKADLVAMCEANPVLVGTNGPVDVSAACPVLKAWDVHDNLDSKGAILFRRFAENALGTTGASPFREPFDANDPVHTPRGLNTDSPAVKRALADAVSELNSKKIPLDAPLRGWQYEERNGEKIPIHGGPGDPDGVFNAINVSGLSDKGYTNVPHGSSFVMVTHFKDGCPENRSILTYSLSTDPTSPYFGDQTRMFSNKEWVNPPFCESQITRDPALQVTRVGPGGASAVSGRGCLVRRRALTRRGLGTVRLRDTRTRMTRRAGAPSSRTSRLAVYCVRGGGRVVAVFARSRSVVVATNVRGARVGRVRVGTRRRGVSGIHRRGHTLYRLRRGRVTWVGVATSTRRARTYARAIGTRL